jgi:hypothetical protein
MPSGLASHSNAEFIPPAAPGKWRGEAEPHRGITQLNQGVLRQIAEIKPGAESRHFGTAVETVAN